LVLADLCFESSRKKLLFDGWVAWEFSAQASVDHVQDCALSRRDATVKERDTGAQVDDLERSSELQR
jgi:hypothetical protein